MFLESFFFRFFAKPKAVSNAQISRETKILRRKKTSSYWNCFAPIPQSAFKLMFDTYYMPLCLYAVQLTDSFSMAEDIVQDFFISFLGEKTYQNIAVKLRSYLFYAIRNNSYLSLRKNNLVSMEELFDTEIDITESITDEEELREKERKIMEELEKLPKQELSAVQAVILENKNTKKRQKN